MALYSLYYLVNERKIQTESDLKYIFVVYKVNKNCDPVFSFFSVFFLSLLRFALLSYHRRFALPDKVYVRLEISSLQLQTSNFALKFPLFSEVHLHF